MVMISVLTALSSESRIQEWIHNASSPKLAVADFKNSVRFRTGCSQKRAAAEPFRCSPFFAIPMPFKYLEASSHWQGSCSYYWRRKCTQPAFSLGGDRPSQKTGG